MSESTTILDATAGNRMIWRTKSHPKIIWIDIEPELHIPPDKVMDCTKTIFLDESLNCIFFDPPHGYGKKLGGSWTSLRNMEDCKNYKWKAPRSEKDFSAPPYWGWDKYKTKSQLLGFIHRAQKEFYRILKEDGMLWVKWNECNIPLDKILPFFKKWHEMLRFPIANPLQTIGESQTYWIMFMKNPDVIEPLDLTAFATKEDTP